jgi:hypothetical protein
MLHSSSSCFSHNYSKEEPSAYVAVAVEAMKKSLEPETAEVLPQTVTMTKLKEASHHIANAANDLLTEASESEELAPGPLQQRRGDKFELMPTLPFPSTDKEVIRITVPGKPFPSSIAVTYPDVQEESKRRVQNASSDLGDASSLASVSVSANFGATSQGSARASDEKVGQTQLVTSMSVTNELLAERGLDSTRLQPRGANWIADKLWRSACG